MPIPSSVGVIRIWNTSDAVPPPSDGTRFTVYSVNQGADQWHVAYAWHHKGGLYTISEHVAPPLTYTKVLRYLDRIMRNLVLISPQT